VYTFVVCLESVSQTQLVTNGRTDCALYGDMTICLLFISFLVAILALDYFCTNQDQHYPLSPIEWISVVSVRRHNGEK
jgi:hypothetical protein